MDFLTSIPVSAVAVLLSLALFVFLSFKGLGLIPNAIICAVVVSFTTQIGFFPTLFGTFMTESAAFLTSIFFPFVSGGILGSVMLASGCSMSIGKTLVRVLGTSRTPYVIMAITILLNLAGIATTPFIVVPIAMSLLKAANLPRRVGLAAAIGSMYTTMVTLPGVTSTNNMIPTLYYGTDLTAAGLMGAVCWLFSMVLLILYVKFLIWDARRCGAGYDGDGSMVDPTEGKELPGFWVSVVPIVMVVALAIGLTDIVGDAYRAVTIAQIAASLYVVIVCRKFFISALSDVVSNGIKPNVELIVGICLVVGYAGVVQQTACYRAMMDWVYTLNVHPYMLTVIACGLICGICANGYGGMGVFLGAMSGQLMAMPDVNPAALHRLTTMTSTTFDSLPHASSIQINLGVWKMSVKEGYKYCFMATVLNPLLYTLLGVVIAVILY